MNPRNICNFNPFFFVDNDVLPFYKRNWFNGDKKLFIKLILYFYNLKISLFWIKLFFNMLKPKKYYKFNHFLYILGLNNR